MEGLDYWRFCSELTVVQAALLILELDPAAVMAHISHWSPEEQPPGYVAVLTALQNDIHSKWLNAKIQYTPLAYENLSEDIDWDRTRVSVNDLKGWLSERGYLTGFFSPDGPITAEYLDLTNPDFSPKLAAAVNAWKAISEERRSKQSGRSVKADLTKWLNLHAPEYGLTNREGEPNKQAIEEVAKVANWNPKGGAPKTPGDRVAHDGEETDPPF